MEWLIQKAVELGVDQITPLLSDHMAISYDSKRMQKKMTQWKGIIIAACEQSGRNRIPAINQPVSAHTWFSQKQPNPMILLPGSMQRINQKLGQDGRGMTIAIGPEGGWSTQEESLALTNHWQAMSLGPRILRAETASLCALTLLQGALGDI